MTTLKIVTLPFVSVVCFQSYTSILHVTFSARTSACSSCAVPVRSFPKVRVFIPHLGGELRFECGIVSLIVIFLPTAYENSTVPKGPTSKLIFLHNVRSRRSLDCVTIRGTKAFRTTTLLHRSIFPNI